MAGTGRDETMHPVRLRVGESLGGFLEERGWILETLADPDSRPWDQPAIAELRQANVRQPAARIEESLRHTPNFLVERCSFNLHRVVCICSHWVKVMGCVPKIVLIGMI